MIGLRNAIWLSAALWLLIIGAARAQQPSPQEIIGALNMKVQATQQSLDQAYLSIARMQTENAALSKQIESWREYAKPLYAPAPEVKP